MLTEHQIETLQHLAAQGLPNEQYVEQKDAMFEDAWPADESFHFGANEGEARVAKMVLGWFNIPLEESEDLPAQGDKILDAFLSSFTNKE